MSGRAVIPAESFRARPGRMRAHLFENPLLGLPVTLFYDITIPLEPFTPGLDEEDQPVHTEFRLEFLRLPARDWRDLDGSSFELGHDDSDGSIYLGSAHNPVRVRQLEFPLRKETVFRVNCSLYCEFEAEMVAGNLELVLATNLVFEGLFIPSDPTTLTPIAGQHVVLDAYHPEPRLGRDGVWLLPQAPRSSADDRSPTVAPALAKDRATESRPEEAHLPDLPWFPDSMSVGLQRGGFFGHHLLVRQRLPPGVTGWSMARLPLPEAWALISAEVQGRLIALALEGGGTYYIGSHNYLALSSAACAEFTDEELVALYEQHARAKP